MLGSYKHSLIKVLLVLRVFLLANPVVNHYVLNRNYCMMFFEPTRYSVTPEKKKGKIYCTFWSTASDDFLVFAGLF